MSTELKYNINNKQVDHILQLDEKIHNISLILSASISLILTSILIVVLTKDWSQTMIVLLVLGLLGSLIFGMRLYILREEKQELIQQIKNTVHYETIQK